MIDFGIALSKINDEKYSGSYIAKIKYEVYENDSNNPEKFITKVEQENKSLSIITIGGYKEGSLLAKLTVILFIGSFRKLDNVIIENTKKFKVWRTISKEEIYEFSRITKDLNFIHLTEKPIVQGLLILKFIISYMKNEIENFKKIEIRFTSPIYAEDEILINKIKNNIFGYSNCRLSFKCSII